MSQVFSTFAVLSRKESIDAQFRKLGYNAQQEYAHSCPDGGIGRRAGLKHQCRKACRFDPGSGYNQVGGKRSGFLPTFIFRPLTPPKTRSNACSTAKNKVLLYFTKVAKLPLL